MVRRNPSKPPIRDPAESNKMVRTHFKEIMCDSRYAWIDPNCCVPFAMTRPIVMSGVRRLMALFDAHFDGNSITEGGISCGTDTPILVELTGTLKTYVYNHFQMKGLSEANVKERVQSRDVWYGIIDGEHSHSAIMQLMESHTRWQGYEWFVTIVNGGHSVEKYRQLARMQNERHDNKFYIEYTFFDIISNMRTEYERLCQIHKRVSGQDVANAYVGYSITSKKVSTLVQTANTIMRLPSSVIKVIGEISNTEYPELALANPRMNRKQAKSVSEIMEQQDCRVFRKFIHITSLKSAKTFMNAKHKHGEKAQIYSLYRVQDIYRERQFTKAIQPEELTKQYELSIYSIEEEEKFLEYIKPESWPSEMATLRDNLLKTVQLGDEVQSNHGNRDVLPSLKQAYRRHFPIKFRRIEERLLESNNLNKTSTSSSDDIDPPTLIQSDNVASSDSPSSTRKPKDSQCALGVSAKENTNTSPPTDSDVAQKLDKMANLNEKGIRCYNMKWQEFLSETWNVSDKLVDAIITEPPASPSLSFINRSAKKNKSVSANQELSSSDILEVAKKGKRFLKPGAYFIVMIQFEMFQEWFMAFHANGYNVMKKPLIFSYNQNAIPHHQSLSEDFPSGMEEFCVVARLQGTHPEGFNPKFNTKFNLINCEWSRRSSIVTNVNFPASRLCHPGSRKPFRMSEKPIELLAEIVDLFVPAYGTTLDPFAGTLTLPIAALKTSRRCIAIESEKNCFESALDRLFSLSSPIFKFMVNENALEKPARINGGNLDSLSQCIEESSNEEKADVGDKVSGNKTSSVSFLNLYEETSKDVDEIIPSEEDLSINENQFEPNEDSNNNRKKRASTEVKDNAVTEISSGVSSVHTTGSDTISEPPTKLRKSSSELDVSNALLQLKTIPQ